MSRILRIKNASGIDGNWVGQTIIAGEYFDITYDHQRWAKDNDVFTAVGNGDLVLSNGVEDFNDPISGWNWIEHDTMPISNTIDGIKVAVHSSSKPEPEGVTTYAIWTGAGDDLDEPDETLSLGAGDLLTFNMSYDAGGEHVVSKDIKFDPRHGRVWIHEAYLKFEGGGVPDYLDVETLAPPSILQQAVNLDLVIDENNCVTYSPSGPGTGTHGFAATPFLIPRPYAQDGGWNFNGTDLTPSMDDTGYYKISNVEKVVHKFFNKIPLHGTSSNYFTMTSDETSELFAGYFIRISAHNKSNTDWTASCIMEIFRQRTNNK